MLARQAAASAAAGCEPQIFEIASPSTPTTTQSPLTAEDLTLTANEQLGISYATSKALNAVEDVVAKAREDLAAVEARQLKEAAARAEVNIFCPNQNSRHAAPDQPSVCSALVGEAEESGTEDTGHRGRQK